LDQVFLATNLTDNLEEILENLKHKNPQVKEGTMKFLIRCLKSTREAPAKPEVASIAEAAKKLLSESVEGLRAGGAEILGTVMKIMGERAMGPYLEGLDDIRKTKIKEYFETAEVCCTSSCSSSCATKDCCEEACDQEACTSSQRLCSRSSFGASTYSPLKAWCP
jgi:hypothetical protein